MIKSFLMLGQSNMAGRGFIHEVPPIYNERIQMLRNGRWQMMTEPINYDRPVSGIGLAGSFADAWCRQNQEDTIGLIPCAEGGSTLDEWAVDQALFRHAITEAKFAMQNSELTGILWHQGESDSINGNYKVYYKKFLSIIDALRKELNAPNIPLIIGGLGDFLGKEGFGKNCTEYNLVNQELQKFAFEQENCYFVTAEGLTSNPDGIHIDAISQRKFGLRYYEAFSNKQHVLNPLINENELINLIHTRKHSKSEKMYMIIMDLSLGNISYEEFESQLIQINNE
ncbi:sialate O-acetylesterase [Heyndrickxia sporothermodurans]|uniref:sialate O-acetylesterase n=1 Tax=Heyndrickxia sporothermodurans TaxID=46224 RepID=UPI002E1C236F|nr:sialate O-acetylesterase [Heyndrickxia sporothermodurans]MED3654169.1 sialate O-acetylesterase [Heyndrickxia sporothermodurans]MED3696805.1 sialate O-acetylesterase [Heyndrickxia sporothermodurans]MED3780652.1 sialate O-acetylesterase [Heyndrickxia sporothermodurans]